MLPSILFSFVDHSGVVRRSRRTSRFRQHTVEPRAKSCRTTRCQPHHSGPSQAGTPPLQGCSRFCSARVPAGDGPKCVDSCRNPECCKRLGLPLRSVWCTLQRMIEATTNAALAPFTTLELGGPADRFFEATSVAEIREALRWAADAGFRSPCSAADPTSSWRTVGFAGWS